MLLIGLLAAGCDRQKAEAPQAQAANEAAPAATGKGVDRGHKGEAVPNIEILDAMSIDAGSTTNLRQYQDGKPMLVNLWASWCAPCVKELPILQILANKRRGALIVVPISQDSGPQRSVEAFLDKIKGVDFIAYQDPEMKLTSALGVQIMPTTILYDAAGKEVWRFTGDLDWTGPEATKLLSEVSPATAR